MSKMYNYIMKHVAGIGFLCCVIFCVCSIMDGSKDAKGIRASKEARLITPTELQQELVNRGYNLTVDGVVGRETRLAWDLAINQQYMDGVGKKILETK